MLLREWESGLRLATRWRNLKTSITTHADDFFFYNIYFFSRTLCFFTHRYGVVHLFVFNFIYFFFFSEAPIHLTTMRSFIWAFIWLFRNLCENVRLFFPPPHSLFSRVSCRRNRSNYVKNSFRCIKNRIPEFRNRIP